MSLNRRSFIGRSVFAVAATVAAGKVQAKEETKPETKKPDGPVTFQDILDGNFHRYSKVKGFHEQKALVDELVTKINWKEVYESETQMENLANFFIWLIEPLFWCEIFKHIGKYAGKEFTIKFYKQPGIQDKMVFGLRSPDTRVSLDKKIPVSQAYQFVKLSY